jgi:hypothetical protein
LRKRVYLYFGLALALVIIGCSDNNEQNNVTESSDPGEISLVVKINGNKIETETSVLCWEICTKDFRGAPVPAEDFKRVEPVYEVENGDQLEITYTGEPDDISYTAVTQDEITESGIIEEEEVTISGGVGKHNYAVYLGWYEDGDMDNVSGIIEAVFTIEIKE